MAYTLKLKTDTWLKQTTAQSADLPDSQKQLVGSGTILPLAGFQLEGEHINVTFGRDRDGTQINFKGRNTWYVYEPAVDVLLDGRAIAPDTRQPLSPAYTLRFDIDTVLKQTMTQSSSLSDDQKQLVAGKTILPLSTFAPAGNLHLKVTLGLDDQGQQVSFKDRNTWYVYRPAVEVLREGEPVNLFPPASSGDPSDYMLQIRQSTWLKLQTAQSAALPTEQKFFLQAGTVLPLSSYMIEGDHLKLALGQDAAGNQIHIRGRNTWYVYLPAIQVLRDRQPISLTSGSVSIRTNPNGLRLIKTFEGLRLESYLDAVGVWTIGYGTTAGVKPGMKITRQQAETLLKQDLRRFEAAVARSLRVPVNSDQFSALVSFTYNVGEGALRSSTLLRLLNQNNMTAAAEQFLRWNRGGGRVLPGLTRRRRAERALFLRQDFTVFL